MKKLYFLNEEEKERILNLHKKRTNQQYLAEQLPWEEKKGIRYPKPGEWTENAYDSFMFLINSWQNTSRSGFKTSVREWCTSNIINKELGLYTLKQTAIQSIVDEMGRLIDNDPSRLATWGGRGLDKKTIPGLLNAFKKFNNVNNMCWSLNGGQTKKYKPRNEDIMDMLDEIYSNNVFNQFVSEMLTFAENTKKFDENDKTEENDKTGSFKSYPCTAKLPFYNDDPDIKVYTLSRVPLAGQKFFLFSDGTYLSEDDYNDKLEQSGTYSCGRMKNIILTPSNSTPPGSLMYRCVKGSCVADNLGTFKTKEECENATTCGKGKTGGGGGVVPTGNNLCHSWGCVTKNINNQLGGVNQNTINDMANKLGIK
jgi:hypothetical protein